MLRRSAAALSAGPLLGLAVFTLFRAGTPWRGEWAWTIDWASGFIVLLAPVLAGTAAFETVTWYGARRLTDATARAEWARLVPACVALAFAAAVYAVSLLVAGVVTAPVAGSFSVDPRTVVLSMLSLAAAAALGAALATIWPRTLVAAIAAAAVLVVSLAEAFGATPPIFAVAGVTGSIVGLHVSTAFFFSVGGTLIALTVSGVMVPVGATGRLGRLLSAIVLLVTVISLTALQLDTPERLVPDTDPPSYRCAGEEPRVCLAEQTPRLLDELPRQLADRTRLLRDVGIAIPARFTQVLPGHSPERSAPLYLEDPNRDRLSLPELDDAVATPAVCAQDTAAAPPPDAVWSARSTIAAWLALRADDVTAADLSGRSDADWLRRDLSDQRDWLTTTYDALSRCDFDRVTAAP